MKHPTCPTCGQPARLTITKHGDRHDCCGLWSWGGKPLADYATHLARRCAHNAFDPLWRRYRVPRGKAYKMLAEELGLTQEECHMSIMTAEQASRVPPVIVKLKQRLGIHE